MTEDATASAPLPAAPRKGRWRPRRPRGVLGWAVAALWAAVLLALLAVAVGRYGVLTPQARLLIEARTDGLKLGRFGRLKVEGLEGDIWRRFSVRRLTISDEDGVWLEARRVRVDWSYGALLRRNLDVDDISADLVQLRRRPTFSAKGKDQGMPVSVRIDRAAARLEMLPAFSRERGVWDVTLQGLEVRRGGGTRVAAQGASILHPGDFLRVKADLGRDKTILVEADAAEARGGSLAGALGLSPDQPFSLKARATGTMSRGALSLASRSGDIVPLRAGGAWSPQGGAVNAYLLLSSSRLLDGWERRFGPSAHFDIVGRRRPDKLYDLTAKLTAENLTLEAKGPADMGTRQTKGMAVTGSIGDLNPIFSFPELGGAQVSGRFVGGFDQFTFAGDASAFEIVNGEYRIDRVDGPAKVTFAKGQFDIYADVQARNGGGSGWQNAVAGPAPKAAVHMQRLKDGRMLYRSIDATGRGLRLKGTGDQSLLGGLNFKGDLEVFNLETAHKGAGGSARFQWTAHQRDVESPWNFTYDGAGEKFTSGYAELDRLLGPSPKVTGNASILRGVVTAPQAVLKGAAAELKATGVQQADGQIRYEGTWVANGPFGVGPVAVEGDMRGKGTLTGTWLEPKADLTADIDTLALPQLTVKPGVVALTFVRDAKGAIVGGVGLTGGSAYGPARAKAGFRFAEDGVDLQGIDADLGGVRARGALALRASTPSSADLTLDVGPGALLTEGRVEGSLRIVDRPGGAVASVRLESSGAVLRAAAVVIEKGAFVGEGPLARLPYRLDASGGWNRNPLVLKGQGTIVQDDRRWTVSFDGGGQARTTRFDTAEPALVAFGPGEQSARLRLDLGGGRADVEARQTAEGVNIAAALKGVDVKFLSEDFVGRFDAALSLDGKGRDLDGVLTAKLDGARSRDAAASTAMNGEVKAVIAGDRMTVDAAVASGQNLTSSANFAFPVVATAAPFRIAIARERPMQGRFDADGEIQPLWDLFLGGERTLGGRVVAQARVAGTLNDPIVNGQVTVQNGRFEDYATGLRLRDLQAAADLKGNLVQVREFTAKDGVRGAVSGSGRASLERGGASDFTLKLTDFRLIDNDIAVADASGDVTLTRGAEGNVKIVGDLSIDEAEVNAAARLASNVPTMDVVEVNRPISLQGQLPQVQRRGPGAALDVRLRAPRRVFVRGRGLDVEMSLNAHVTGTTSAPDLSGTARVVRGDYEFGGKTFEFDERGLVQLSTNPAKIRLDLQAVRDDPSLTAVVRILGTAAKPEISLTSTPVLPNDEVLSQVLFGRSASQLSPLEAAQLASALTGLASGGGFDVIGNLRAFAGLDRLSFSGGGAQAVSVAGGKYLTDDVYLEIAGGGRDGASTQVEYRVNRSLSIISRLTADSGAKLAVRWRKDLADRRRNERR